MNSDTKITKNVLEILGDKDKKGYYINVDNIRVPIHLNKGHTTEYPEITVMPFTDKKQTYVDRFIKKDLSKLLKHYNGVFEVNIFSEDLSLGNKISSGIEDRVLDFSSITWSEFNYNNEFKKTDDHYENIAFANVKDNPYKNVFKITVEGKKLLYSKSSKEDSWYIDKDALYVKTERNIKTILVYVLYQGRVFKNKDTLLDRDIYSCVLTDREDLDEKEKNEVGRKIYNLNLLFKEIKERQRVPEVDRVGFYPKKDDLHGRRKEKGNKKRK